MNGWLVQGNTLVKGDQVRTANFSDRVLHSGEMPPADTTRRPVRSPPHRKAQQARAGPRSYPAQRQIVGAGWRRRASWSRTMASKADRTGLLDVAVQLLLGHVRRRRAKRSADQPDDRGMGQSRQSHDCSPAGPGTSPRTTQLRVFPDTTPPTGGITAPAEGTTITSRTAYLSGWAVRQRKRVRAAHFMATFSGIQRQIGLDFTGSPFSFSWDMCDDDAPNGQISLTAGGVGQSRQQGDRSGRHQALHQELLVSRLPPPPGNCTPSSDGVHLFRNEELRRGMPNLHPDNPDLNGSRIGNNQASSIKIVGPYEAWLYKSQNYQEGESHFGAATGTWRMSPAATTTSLRSG